MQWLRSYSYIFALALTIFLIIVGVFIVGKKSAVQPDANSDLRAWIGADSNLYDPSSRVKDSTPANQDSLYTEVRSGPPFHYVPANAQIPQTQTGYTENLDLDELLTELSRSPKDVPAKPSTSAVDAYSFIPTGLLSISSDTEKPDKTELQQTLYDYGNEAAGNIQSYEDLYRHAPQIMKNQFEDRRNADKNAAFSALANGLTNVGDALLAMEEVPLQISSAHKKLGSSYMAMGERLSRIPVAKDDQALIEAMLSYNAVVEAYTKNYIALANLFSAYDVKFKSGDPGSIFTFTNATSI